MSPLLRQLGELCRQHPVAPKYVFVPSRQVGYNLGNALAVAGCNWVNLELITPVDHAAAAARAWLAVEGWKRAPEDVQLLLVEDILEEMVREQPASYFAQVPPSTGLSRAFLSTIKSLRLAGVLPESLSAVLHSEKGHFAGALYTRYVERLEKAYLADDAMLLRKAAAIEASASDVLWAVLDETPVPGLVGQYLRHVSGGSLRRIGTDVSAVRPPRRAAVSVFAGPRSDKAPGPEATPLLRACIGSEGEARSVLRDILTSGVGLDQVEVAYTSEQPYLSRFADLADRYGIAATFGSGLPSAFTRPGQAVAGFLRWIAGGFEARDLVALARGGLLDPILPRDGERALQGHELAREIGGARIKVGRHQYRLQLHRRLTGAAPGEHRTTRLTMEAVNVLLDLAAEARTSTVAGLAQCASDFLARFARVSTERDRVAIDSLQDRLAELTAAAPIAAGSSHPAARLLDLLKEHKIAAAAARPGSLHVVPLSRAGYTGRPCLFVVGMDEGSFPGAPVEDPILLDDERRRVSEAIDLLRQAPSEKVWHLHRVLSSGAERVVLLTQRHSISDGREVYPSAFFQELADRQPVEYESLLPEPAAALDATELLLAARASSGAASALLKERYPYLAIGYQAAERRRDRGFSTFHGWVGRPVEVDLVPGGESVTSASQLETLMQCPYKYFLRYVLGVRPPEEPDDDPSRWLGPHEFGNLLHELFRRFMLERKRDGDRPDFQKHHARIMHELSELIEAYRTNIPAVNEAAFKADEARLRRAAEIFLKDEARREGELYACELSFGEGREGHDPVVLRLSPDLEIRLRGRIDRVDKTKDGFEIWDYKTGSPNQFNEADLLQDGRRLQWALYAYALDEITRREQLTADPRATDAPTSGEAGASTSASGYFFASDRGHGLRYAAAPPARGHVSALLEPILSMARDGAFLHLQKKHGCAYCDYASVCSDEAVLCTQLEKDLDADPAAVPDDVPFRDALLQHVRSAP